MPSIERQFKITMCVNLYRQQVNILASGNVLGGAKGVEYTHIEKYRYGSCPRTWCSLDDHGSSQRVG
ncbi:hypothetical protein GGD46_006377 [Rhizobium lusitanum]|uniref:Uncharacterized protein n=1 Tax=Rhizobium lusitanum TaxID=293958 RepID=A0A7X0MG20_9HYPH|nr:hypothetical protein [Rhizobium lusitanum]